MWQKIKSAIPKETLMNLLICISGILLIVFVGIVPNHLKSAKLAMDIDSLQFKGEEQKTLHPVYQLLNSRNQNKMSTVLPCPVKSPLSRQKVGTILSIFEGIAKNSGMNTVSISPDFKSLDAKRNLLPVEIIIIGDFVNYRKFLIALEELPYLERVEELQIHYSAGIMEFRTKIIIALSHE
jgi:hypothetical protein